MCLYVGFSFLKYIQRECVGDLGGNLENFSQNGATKDMVWIIICIYIF